MLHNTDHTHVTNLDCTHKAIVQGNAESFIESILVMITSDKQLLDMTRYVKQDQTQQNVQPAALASSKVDPTAQDWLHQAVMLNPK